MVTTAQIVAISVSALLSTVLTALIVGVRERRRVARRRQAEEQVTYAAAVTGYRAAVETALQRRAEMVELLEVAWAGRADRALTSTDDVRVDSAVSRLYLDLALAGDDRARQEDILDVVRRGISDLEILMPEVPLAPAPVAGLNRRDRKAAAQWQAAREAEVDALGSLSAHGAAAPTGPVGVPNRRMTTQRLISTELAVAS